MTVHTVNINGIDLVYEKEGSGPPLVFLHGGNLSSLEWEAVVPHLLHAHTCYVLDQRGHGRSGRVRDGYSFFAYADEAIGFLDAVVGPATLIGHSQGGHAAFGAAAKRPDLVTAIYSEDAIPAVGTVTAGHKIPLFRMFGPLGEIVRTSQREGLGVAEHTARIASFSPFGAPFADQLSPPQLLAFGRGSYATDPAWYEAAANIDHFAWPDEAAGVIDAGTRCPVHLAYGNPALGSLVRPPLSDNFADQSRRRTSTYFPDCGHNIQSNQPREFINDLKAFLSRLPV